MKNLEDHRLIRIHETIRPKGKLGHNEHMEMKTHKTVHGYDNYYISIISAIGFLAIKGCHWKTHISYVHVLNVLSQQQYKIIFYLLLFATE